MSQLEGSTWGVDLSTDPRSTAAVRIEWTAHGAHLAEVNSPLPANDLIDLIRSDQADPDRRSTWGVDVPFGWPTGFADFVTAHQLGPAPVGYPGPSWASPFRLRRTDQNLTAGVPPRRVIPLSVAHDRLGSVAVLWAHVEHELDQGTPPIQIDRSGMTGCIFETYPSGLRVQWGLPKRGAGGDREAVTAMAAELGVDIALLAGSTCSTEHEWDAMLCAFAARAHQLGERPDLSTDDAIRASREGWIHLPGRLARIG